MTEKSVAQKPSETALIAALRRTLAYKAYQNERFGPDHLAEIFLPAHFRFFLRFNKIRENTRKKLDGFFPGMTEYLIARTAFFDRQFASALQDRTPQIVLLGAGYDSRAYRMAQLNRGTRVFELDIAPTQERKKKCLKAARLAIPPQVKFVPINFNEEPLREVLEKASYQPQEKTLFLWEGVSMYLDPKSVDATLELASRASPGSAIAFDYTLSLTEENMDHYYGAKEFAQTMREQHADEALTFSLEAGQIEPFLAQRGLKLVEHLDPAAIERAYLTDEHGSLIGHMNGHFCFVAASPQDK